MANKTRSNEKLRFIVSTERHRVAMDQLWEQLDDGALKGISPIESANEDLRQRDGNGEVITDPRVLHQSAEAAHNHLVPYLQRICSDFFDGRVYLPTSEEEPMSGVYLAGAKAMDAIGQKAMREYAQKNPGPHFAWVHDVVRHAIVCDSDAQARDVVQRISGEMEVVKLKNRFLRPTMTGFMDILMYVRVNHFICELQIQLLPLFLHEQDNHFHERYEMYREFLRGPQDMVMKRLELISYLGKFDEFDEQGSEYAKTVNLDAIVEDFLEESEENTTERVAAMEDLCEFLGELPAATKLQERLTQMFRDNGVEEDVGSALNNLGMLLQVQQRLDDAHKCFEEALAIRKRVLGDDPAVDASVHNLALVLRAQGKLQESIPLYRELLELKTKRFGDEHPESDSARANLATLLQSFGELEEAELLGRQSLETRRKVLGESHPEVGKALNNLAVCLREQQKFEESESLLREALNMARQALGQIHPFVAGAMNNLAMVLEDQSKFVEAEPLYRHALEAFVRTVGPEHAETISTLDNLATCLQQQSKFEEAEHLFRQLLSVRREALGENHPVTIQTREQLALVMRASGNHEEADLLAPRPPDTGAMAAAAEHKSTPVAARDPAPQTAKTTERAPPSAPTSTPTPKDKPQSQVTQQPGPMDVSTMTFLAGMLALLVALIAWIFS